MEDKTIKYLKSKAEDLLSKNNHKEAVRYFIKLYDWIITHGSHNKNNVYTLIKRIVKLLNIIAMKNINKGKD